MNIVPVGGCVIVRMSDEELFGFPTPKGGYSKSNPFSLAVFRAAMSDERAQAAPNLALGTGPDAWRRAGLKKRMTRGLTRILDVFPRPSFKSPEIIGYVRKGTGKA